MTDPLQSDIDKLADKLLSGIGFTPKEADRRYVGSVLMEAIRSAYLSGIREYSHEWMTWHRDGYQQGIDNAATVALSFADDPAWKSDAQREEARSIHKRIMELRATNPFWQTGEKKTE